MAKKFRDVQGFVFDFDGVFYGFKHVINLYTLCDMTMAFSAYRNTVLKQAGITLKTAKELARNGHKTYGDAITGFCVWAQENGVEPESFKADLFAEYHKNLRMALLKLSPHIFENRRDLKSAFNLSQGLVQNGIATHSCATHIARPFLASMGIRQYFEDAAVIGLANGDYTLKHTDPRLIELACTAMGLHPDDIAFVEDTPRNLQTFKDKYPSAVTIYIHHGRPLDPLPDYIDVQFYNILEMKRAWSESRKEPGKIISLSNPAAATHLALSAPR